MKMGVYDGFKAFMFKHKIPATAAAFSIGGASADMARTMSTDIILPIVVYLAHLAVPSVRTQPLRVLPFFGTVVSWGCVLVTSYILMELVFSRTVLGASLNVLDEKEEAAFTKAQDVAKEPIKQASQAIKEMVAGNVEGTSMYAPVDPRAGENATEPCAYEVSHSCASADTA